MKQIISAAFAFLILMTACRLAADLPPASTPDAEITPSPVPPEAQPRVESTEPILDIRYSDEPASRGELLSLDIYPLTGNDHPVLIFVHGGGWVRGDKSSVNAKPAAFNARGFVFVSVNYRLIPEVDIVQQMTDVARAVAWVKQNIHQYGGDASRLFLMGHSAGAHLVSLLGTDESYLRTEGLGLADLAGIVSLDTQAYDMFKLMSNLSPEQGEVYWKTFGDDPEFWKTMSPQWHTEADKNIPPFLIAYTGEKQSRVFFSEQFVKTLQEAGVSSELLPAPEKTHGEINREFGESSDRISQIVFEWLEKLLHRPD